MNAGGNLEMNAGDDGWADEMVERWFEEGDREQGDEPPREDQARRTDPARRLYD